MTIANENATGLAIELTGEKQGRLISLESLI
jgi:hypothetical protein